MFRTGGRRAISASARVYPPIPPMPNTSAFAGRRGLANVRWVPTIFALVSIGYGVSVYRRDGGHYVDTADRDRMEVERRQREAVMMDAYGDKSSLEDLEKAMAFYESQRKR
ncbi:unnamed protein product [Discula destructiva]